MWADFVPRNTTVNSEYYKGLLEHLRNNLRRKWPEKWANGFILHHDNAPCHTLLLVRQFLSNKNIMVCPHPPYSPDLALCDFWLFPKVKMTMNGKHFESIQDVEAATTVQLKTLMKEDFQNCFRNWQERWDKCVRSEGEYFEGINGTVSFTVIIFFYFNIQHIFWSHLVCVCVCVCVCIYICIFYTKIFYISLSSHLFSSLWMYSDNLMPLVYRDWSPKLFPPWIRCTDKKLDITRWKWVMGNYVTLRLCCFLFSHSVVYKVIVCVYSTEWSSVDLMECNNLKYSVCRMCIHFVFIANCVLVYSLLPVELLINEHLISLSVHKKLT